MAACSGDQGLNGVLFAKPETSVSYDVTLSGLPEPEIVALAEETLAVYLRQDEGAPSVAFLRRRAQDDVETLQKILRSFGYYNGTAQVRVTQPEETERPLVTITVEPGEVFTLQRHDFVFEDRAGASLPEAAALGSPVGAAARASAIVDAETAAVDLLQRRGFPYAERTGRRALANPAAATLEVESQFVSGPATVFGPITYQGLEDVRERYLRTYVPWSEGATFNVNQLRDYQKDLLGTDLFETITVKPPETPPDATGPVALPITVTAAERPVQTVAAGVKYSTDEGPSVTGSYEHRNLFGENETFTARAEVGLELQQLDLVYREPQYMRPKQELLAGIRLKREIDDAFDELTATGSLGLRRRISRKWVLGAGGLLETSLIDDTGGEKTAYLAGLPLTAEYDRTDDLLDPSKGQRLFVQVTPFAGLFDDEFASFLTVDATGSTYYDLTGERAYILAGRARLGSILADELDTVPQTRRLYSGGGGSVRGYAERYVGPLDPLNDPIGGRSVAEIGLELRARVYGDLGGVIFVEAGAVSEEVFPDFENDVQVAAGFGLRYYSPAGPIRIDLGFPIDRRDADDAFQLYFSIGQAF